MKAATMTGYRKIRGGIKMVFTYNYFRDGKTYSFYLDDAGDAFADHLRVVSPDGVEKFVRVKESLEFALKGHKTFLEANGGARGLFVWLADCARENFCTCYIDIIIDSFNSDGSKLWKAV